MISVDALVAHLGTAVSAADKAVLAEIEAGVVAFVESATGRSFAEAAASTEIYDGGGEQVLELKAPIAAGTPTVYTRARRSSTWTEIDSDQWYVDTHPSLGVDNLIVLYAYKWPWGERNVKVVCADDCTAGYTVGEEPAEIRLLVTELTTIRFRNRVVGSSLSDGASGRPDDLPSHLAEVLKRWRLIPAAKQPRLVRA